jgi:hypothetical protein
VTAKKLKVVTDRDDPTVGKVWDFTCPYPTGCGGPEGPFASTGWFDRQHAVDRAKEHLDEHEGKGPMSSLDEFRAARGLTAATAGPPDYEL